MNNKEQQPKKKPATKAKAPTKKLGIKKQETTEDIINKALKASEDKWQLKFESFQEKLIESISKQIETALSSKDGLKPQINKLNTAIQALGTSSDPDHPSVMDLPRAIANKIDPLVTQGKSYIKDKEIKAHENEKRLVSEQKENLSQLKANLIEEKSQHGSNLEREEKLKEKMEYLDEKIRDNNEKMDNLQSSLDDIEDILTSESDESSSLEREKKLNEKMDQLDEKIDKVKEAKSKPNHIEDIFTEDYKWYSLAPSDKKKHLEFHLVNKIQFYHKESLGDMQMVTFVSNKNGEDVELDPRILDIEGQTALMDYIDYLNAEKSS